MIASIVEFTYIDITTHDIYALPWGSLCYTGNTNPDCQNIETITNCPNGGDACIEAKYAAMLTEESLYIAGIMVFIKMMISHIVLRLKVNAIRIFQAFVWGISPVILLYTSWEDYLYYSIRAMPIPSTLPWLNSAGLYPYVMQYITHDTIAMQGDMFLIMATGLLAILFLWYLNSEVSKKAGYTKPL